MAQAVGDRVRELQQLLHVAKEQAAILTMTTPHYEYTYHAWAVLTIVHAAKEQVTLDLTPNHNPDSNQAAANETVRLEAALEQATCCISIRKRP